MTNGFDMQKQHLYALGLIKHIYFSFMRECDVSYLVFIAELNNYRRGLYV